MGRHQVGEECCNNCMYWRPEYPQKFEGTPPKTVFTRTNCAACGRTGKQTLDSSTCSVFAHIGGVSRTFAPANTEQAPSDATGAMIAGMDDPGRAYLQATMDYVRTRARVRKESQKVGDGLSDAERRLLEAVGEDYLDSEEEACVDPMKEQARANERTPELIDEGMDTKYVSGDMAVDFMHMLDRARAGNPKDQFAFAKAFWEGTHGVMEAKVLSALGKDSLSWEWCRKAAEQGLPDAQYTIGHSGREGNEASIEWLSKAAAQGHVKAAEELTSLRSKLFGKSIEYLNKCLSHLPDDVDDAISCIRSAAAELEPEWGETILLYKLDKAFVKSFVERIEREAKDNSPDLQNVVGKMYASYASYRNILEKNSELAVVWFKHAAERGCIDAMDNLGICYANGDGIEKDDKAAVQWYRKAAAAGLDWGQYHLAVKLIQGEGVDKNISEARTWLQKAAAQGLKKASERLNTLADESSASDDPSIASRAGWKLWGSKRYVDAVKYFKMAADAGLADAKYALGWCYYCGDGVAKNTREAVRLFKSVTEKWFSDSDTGLNCGVVRNMYANACHYLGDCYKSGDGVEEDIEAALDYYKAAARSGNHKAAAEVGCLYLWGHEGLKPSPADAVYWLQHTVWGNIGKSKWDVNSYAEGYLKEARAALEKVGDDEDMVSSLLSMEDDFKKAYSGDTEAQIAVADRFEEFDEVDDVDNCAAIYWRHLAALSGNASAQFEIGRAYYFGEGVEENEPEAFKWFEKAAQQGHAEAQCRYAECFLQGNGVEKDLAKAREWYTKSAEQGEALAQFNLGKIYYFGKGVEKDYVKAAEWFAKAADDGRADAQLFLGTCYRRGLGVEKDLDKAFELYKKAADDKGEAKFWLGKFYEKGWGSVEKDVATAYDWYLKAAEDGYVDAICAVGWAYQRGDGVEQDYAKAVEWFGKGVDEGDGVCANNLARLYEDGNGVEQDLGRAVELFKIASENDCNRAYYHLGRFYENGLGVEIDLSKAKEYYAKAAESGDEDAKAALARM